MQFDRTEWVHILWPMKFFPKAGANLLSLICKHLQRNKIPGDHQNNIVVISSLMDESRLMTVGSPELNSFKKLKKRGHNQLRPYSRKMSMTYTLNLDILPSPSPMPLLKPLVSKSLVASNCVKNVLWARPSNEQ